MPCAKKKDAEEAHATLRPQVAADARFDARLDEAHEKVTAERLALQPKQRDLLPHRLAARELVARPASSTAVERLFSQVGIAFAAKRKSASAATLEDIMFSRINLP